MVAGRTIVSLGMICFAREQLLFYMVSIFPCRFPAASLFIKKGNNLHSGPCNILVVRTLKVKNTVNKVHINRHNFWKQKS